jgi:hypothetical protein
MRSEIQCNQKFMVENVGIKVWFSFSFGLNGCGRGQGEVGEWCKL